MSRSDYTPTTYAVDQLVDLAHDAYLRLLRPRPAVPMICHHLGVSAGSADHVSVGLNAQGFGLLVTAYRDSEYHDRATDLPYGYPLSEHDRLVDALVARFDVPRFDRWNGEDGHSGVSIVLALQPPQTLVDAIDAYRRMPNVFKPTEDENQAFRAFRAWYSAPLT
jgi:hypothetical protein